MVTENKREMRDPPPVPTFGKAVSSFEDVQRYLCPYKIDDASFGTLEHLEAAAVHLITPDQQSKHHSAIIVESNIPDIHACNSCCMHT
jgi:hypothetical protein